MESSTNSGELNWHSMTGQPKILPKMGVVVGIPSSRLVDIRWAVALAVQVWPANTNTCYIPVPCGNKNTGRKGPPRDQGREIIVESARKLGAPYIWMIDDDVEVPRDACRQLLRTLKEADPDVMAVGGIYPEKNAQGSPVVYTENGTGPDWRWKKNTVFPASLIGTGCMMIKTEAFDKITRPWFKDVNDNMVNITDDAWFVMKLRDAGLKVLADANVICRHWDYENNICYQIPEDSYPMRDDPKESVDIERALNTPDFRWPFKEELEWLAMQAKRHERIVEIGSYLGRSTCALAANTPGKVWAFDDWYGPRDDNSVRDEDRPQFYSQFIQNTSGLPVIAIKADHGDFSAVPVELIREAKPDMVFIDGAHDYQSVKRDVMAWKERLAPGGLLCGHDSNWYDVQMAVREICPGFKQAPNTTIWYWEKSA